MRVAQIEVSSHNTVLHDEEKTIVFARMRLSSQDKPCRCFWFLSKWRNIFIHPVDFAIYVLRWLPLLPLVTNSESEKETSNWSILLHGKGIRRKGEGWQSCFRHLKILMDDYNLFHIVTHWDKLDKWQHWGAYRTCFLSISSPVIVHLG